MGDEITNPHLREVCQDGYVLKVTNRNEDFDILSIRFHISVDLSLFCLNHLQNHFRQDSKDPSFTDAQNLLILHMAKVLLEIKFNSFKFILIFHPGRLGCARATAEHPWRVGKKKTFLEIF